MNAISIFYAIYHVAIAGRYHEEQKNSSLWVSEQKFVYMRAVDPHQSEMFPRIHSRDNLRKKKKTKNRKYM